MCNAFLKYFIMIVLLIDLILNHDFNNACGNLFELHDLLISVTYSWSCVAIATEDILRI